MFLSWENRFLLNSGYEKSLQFAEEEPWNDAKLYQPYEAEQILLAENASCLAVKAYLNVSLVILPSREFRFKQNVVFLPFQMCNLTYTVEACPNAEYMSPGGHMTKLPILQCGAFVVSELEPIINLVEKKGHSLTAAMDPDEKNDLRAYLSLTEKIFTNAEVHTSINNHDY